MLQTADSMSRRLGILLLLAVVSLSGSATCTRGAMACPMVRQAAHDCCKHRATLRSDDCCCKAAHQLTSQAISTAPQTENVSVRLVVALLHPVLSPTTDSGSLSVGHLLHGVAPPDTPITQHTLLLL